MKRGVYSSGSQQSINQFEKGRKLRKVIESSLIFLGESLCMTVKTL